MYEFENEVAGKPIQQTPRITPVLPKLDVQPPTLKQKRISLTSAQSFISKTS